MTRFEESWGSPNPAVVAIVPTPNGGFFTSDGDFYKNNFVTEDWLRRLERAEQRQQKLKQGALAAGKPLHKAKNYQKQVKKVARMYADLDHHREDFLHKMTSELVREYGVLCVPRYYKKERLPKELSDPLNDLSWEKMIHKLNYKCQWSGRVFYATPLERQERDLDFAELAQVLCQRALCYAESIDLYRIRSVGLRKSTTFPKGKA